MQYLKLTDGIVSYPYEIWRLREDFPNTSFVMPYEANNLTQFDVHPVTEIDPPAYSELTHRLVENQPVLVDGNWAQQWSVDALPQDDVAANIEARKTELLTAINVKRDRLEESGFTYQGKLVDSDPRSVQRINTSVQAAQAAASAGQSFSLDWTCADGSTLTLDAAGMMGMPVALAMYANVLHQHARALKELVANATTVAQIEQYASDIEADWAV